MEKKKGTAIKTVFTKITPEIAKEWLKHNVRNRKVKQNVVTQIARDIISGFWQSENPNPISFYDDGTLADGQHRLMAIVSANKPVYCIVMYNVPKAACPYIDTNKARSVSDLVSITTGDKSFSPKLVSVIRGSIRGGKTMSPQQFIDFHDKYREDIQYIMDLFNGANSKLKYTPVISAVFMAYFNGVSKKVLSDFCEIYKTGITYTDKDITVTALRDYVLMSADKRGKTNSQEMVLRAQQAIYNYSKNKSVSKCTKCSDYRYPFVNI